MAKKIIVTESQLKKLVQHQAMKKLNEGVTFNDEESMGDELNVDTEDGKFVDGEEMTTDEMNTEMGMEDEMGDISLNEGKLKLKDTFNKLTKNPIINSLSSQVLKK